MRFLKQRNLSRRIPNDTTLYSDATNTNVTIAPQGAGNLFLQALNGAVQLPTGTTGQQPSPSAGMVRYNTTTSDVEVYQGSSWRALRYRESGTIIQQNLGAGDDSTIYFGPLSSAYNPANVSSTNGTYGGQNILVVVENVIQLNNINYTVTDNPTIASEVYTPTLSVPTSAGSKTIYFNSSLIGSGASGDAVHVTLTFATQSAIPFAVGSSIIVTGFRPIGYNGTYTVTSSTSGSVSFASAFNGSFQSGGTITSSSAVYVAVDITGATVTNAHVSSTVVSFTSDPITDALTSVTLNDFPSGIDAVNTTITITEGSRSISGPGDHYYLKFTEAVPYGKVVTALIGFDQ